MSNVSMQNLAGSTFSDGFVFTVDGAESPAASSGAALIDAELLFSGNYDRVGVDLVISSETGSVTVPEYFKGEYRAALMSAEGASLSGRVVEAMTARVQYAQADQIASAVAAVGNAAKVSGFSRETSSRQALIPRLGLVSLTARLWALPRTRALFWMR